VNRRAPELALVTGLLLAVPIGGFALWATGDVSRSLLTGAGLLYPFAVYAVYHDDDPTTVLPPRAVAVAGGLLGAVPFADAVVADAPLPGVALRGAFLGLLVAAPAWAYALGYGRAARLPDGRLSLAGAGVAGAALLLVGLLVGTPFGAAAALVVWLTGALAARSAGFRATEDARLGAVGAGVVLGVALLFATLLWGRTTAAAVLSAVTLAIAPAVYYGLTAETASFE